MVDRFFPALVTVLVVAMRWLRGLFPWACLFVAAVVLILGWGSALLHLAENHSDAATLQYIQISPRASDVYLGRRRLMQNEGPTSADEPHVRFQKIDGQWHISNVSSRRRLSLRYSDGADYNADRRVLADGDVITLTPAPDPVRITVKLPPQPSDEIEFEITAGAASSTRRLAVRNTSWGVRVTDPQTNAAVNRACPVADGDGKDGILSWMRRFLRTGRERAVVRVGGIRADCVREGVAYIAIPGRPMGLFEIRHIPKRGYALIPGSDLAARFIRGNMGNLRLTDIQHPMVLGEGASRQARDARPIRLDRITVGRSKYRVEWPAPQDARSVAFKLVPGAGAHRISGPNGGAGRCPDIQVEGGLWFVRCAEITSAAQVWQGFLTRVTQNGYVLASLILAFTGLCFAVSLGGRAFGDLPRSAAAGFAVTAAIIAFAPEKFMAIPAVTPLAPWPALAAWSAGILTTLIARGATLLGGVILLIATALVAIGHAALAAMAFSTDNLYFANYFDDTTRRAIPIGGALLAVSALVPPAVIVAVARSFVTRTSLTFFSIPPGLFMTIIAVIGLVGLWVLLGTQTGIAGAFQPSEFIKVLFVIVLAAASARALDLERGAYRTDAKLLEWFIFGLLIAFIILVFVAPILRSDHSPFFIMVCTLLAGIFIVSAFHRVALATQRFAFRTQAVPPGPKPLRPPQHSLRAHERLAGFVKRMGKGCVRYVGARPFETLGFVLAPVCLVAMVVVATIMLSNPVSSRSWWIGFLGDRFNTPAERFISWIELNGRTPSGEPPLSIEFPDVGLQVIRSRAIIEASSCSAAPLSLPVSWANAAPVSGWAFVRTMIEGVNVVLRPVGEGLRALICPASGGRASTYDRRSERPRSVESLQLPSVQNDFISTWLFVAMGRDWVLIVALLQCLLAALLLLSAFLVCRWFPGDEPNRAAGAFMAYACVGLTCTLVLQWSISWLNAFGGLPVMGQPSTFLSHGVSHMLGFGVPTLIVILLALRMRSALDPSRIAHLPNISFVDGPLARIIDPRLLRWTR